ncbi:MAG: DMT family transporter [Promethearchaeota archaeon]
MTPTPELFLIGVFMGLVGAALYGFSNVIYKSQSHGIHPVLINALKMWIALLLMAVLVIVMLLFIPWTVPVTAVPLLALSILFGAVFGDLIYLTSQARIGVSRAFPIAMTFPLITYFATVLLFGEPLLLTRLLGVVLAIVGVVLISHEQTNTSQNSNDPIAKRDVRIGILLAILTPFFWTAGALITQLAITGVDPVQGNLFRVLSGSLVMIPIIFLARSRGIKAPTKRATKFTLIAGFFGMGIGSIMYVTAVQLAGAAVMSVLASTAPIFALPFTAFYLKEKITPLILVGTILTICGIWFVVLGF